MRGYFAGLAKQSGLTIGTNNPSPTPASSVGRESAAAPVHVESVVLVEPSTRSFEVNSESRVTEKRNRDTDPVVLSEVRPSRDEASVKLIDPNIRPARPANPSGNSDASSRSSGKQILKQGTSSFLTLEELVETYPTSERFEEPPRTEGGVIRVGEPGNESRRADSLADPFRLSDAQQPPIPVDYLEGIRDWLASPSTSRTNDSSGVVKPADESWAPVNSIRDREPHKEVQEFSLSIGSISIVVEEPAQQSVSPPSTTPAMNKQSKEDQQRGRDAFALSRNYFRGF